MLVFSLRIAAIPPELLCDIFVTYTFSPLLLVARIGTCFWIFTINVATFTTAVANMVPVTGLLFLQMRIIRTKLNISPALT